VFRSEVSGTDRWNGGGGGVVGGKGRGEG